MTLHPAWAQTISAVAIDKLLAVIWNILEYGVNEFDLRMQTVLVNGFMGRGLNGHT